MSCIARVTGHENVDVTNRYKNSQELRDTITEKVLRIVSYSPPLPFEETAEGSRGDRHENSPPFRDAVTKRAEQLALCGAPFWQAEGARPSGTDRVAQSGAAGLRSNAVGQSVQL